jgi:hypothetical protein
VHRKKRRAKQSDHWLISSSLGSDAARAPIARCLIEEWSGPGEKDRAGSVLTRRIAHATADVG